MAAFNSDRLPGDLSIPQLRSALTRDQQIHAGIVTLGEWSNSTLPDFMHLEELLQEWLPREEQRHGYTRIEEVTGMRLLAQLKGLGCGFLGLSSIEEAKVQLQCITVKPILQRKGIATFLLQEGINRSIQAGAQKIQATTRRTNPPICLWLESAGFTIVSETSTEVQWIKLLDCTAPIKRFVRKPQLTI